MIPARGGSKGIPLKNIATLNGKPLISYTIRDALASPMVDRVIVSTDNNLIAETSIELGAEVLNRPEHLATDTATTSAVIKHFLNQYKNVNDFVLLQPTSPFRGPKNLKAAIALYFSDRSKTNVVSVKKIDAKVEWILQENEKGQGVFLVDDVPVHQRQESGDYYILNGAIYIANRFNFLQSGSFFKNFRIFIMEEENSIDIDTLDDLYAAEKICRRL